MRITVPEDKNVILLTPDQIMSLLDICKIIRGPRRARAKKLDTMHNVAGDLMIAIVEAMP